jgi:hypothetical protein
VGLESSYPDLRADWKIISILQTNQSEIPNNILKFSFRFPELQWTEDQQQFRDHGRWIMVTLECQWHGNTGTSTINSNMFTTNNYGLVRIINLETGILFEQN